MEYINRFFDKTGGNPDVAVLSPDQVLASIHVATAKVDKLCLVKGNTGSPQQAFLLLSALTREAQTILQDVQKQEHSPLHQDVMTSSI